MTDARGATRTVTVYANFNTGTYSPIVLDLDGDGISLTSAQGRGAVFDLIGDSGLEHTGWISSGDGFLALDRDGDGLISHGAEISFSSDVNSAQTDLEGLRAYDTNANGCLDTADAQFAEFRVWQDANQDGVSQAEELTSLVARGITGINLSSTPTGQNAENTTDNVIYATTQYTRADGTTGAVGDVFLRYQHITGSVSEGPSVSGSQEATSRVGSDQYRSQPDAPGGRRVQDARLNAQVRALRDALADRSPLEEGYSAAPQSEPSADARSGSRHASWRETLRGLFVHRKTPAAAKDGSDAKSSPALAPSALHAGLGAADKRVLGMVEAMAGFDPRGAADLGHANRLDPKVKELLTALPDSRQI